ncbi:unnamed protein product [Didymodactylos carnosus]|uniref:HAT C-terminal dimerisation domain-containing protein n=1 Tax=Didymodactylos carnosus TaxID=1234261 RepID=A0A815WDA4_9BILA|nr:unnamed protein product [Didymodactylos carnosus]CAF4405048.1 unnamed protein product [Didymodactylos carnosus]
MGDVCTRWNSTYYMIDSYLQLKSIVTKLFDEKYQLRIKYKQLKKLERLEITSNDWNMLLLLHETLKPFYHATRLISGSHYATIGLTYFAIHFIKKFLDNTVGDNDLVIRLKKLLSQSMKHYLDTDDDQSNLLKIHAYFDPLGYAVLSDTDKALIERDLKDMALNNSSLDLSPQQPSLINNNTSTTLPMTGATTKIPVRKPLSVLNAFMASVGQDIDVKDAANRDKNKRVTIAHDLKTYKSLVNSFNTRDSPSSSTSLLFWKNHQKQLPILIKYANKYLSVPGTSVPSESAFSLSAYLARKQRARLSPENLSYSAFLKDKMKQKR